LKELKAVDENCQTMGLARPENLVRFEKAQKCLMFWENKFLDLWNTCQSWDSAGKIRLETLKTCCEDAELPYCRQTRKIILMIESIYRSKTNG